MNKEEWILDSIKIDRNAGFRKKDNDPDYTGNISFENGNYDRFTFNMEPEHTQQYVKIIAKQVVMSAEQLGEKIAQSINKSLKPLDNK